jgi:O-antigen/teichoic acid export membrane protein
VFGGGYRGSAATMIVLLLGLAALSVAVQGHLLQVTTDATFTRNLSVAALVVLYAVAFVATPLYGTVGAAIARITAMWSMFGLTYVVARRTFGAETISGRNASVVIVAVTVSSLVNSLGAGLPLAVRVPFGAALVLALTAGVRGPGGAVAWDLVRGGSRRLRRSLSASAFVQ